MCIIIGYHFYPILFQFSGFFRSLLYPNLHLKIIDVYFPPFLIIKAECLVLF